MIAQVISGDPKPLNQVFEHTQTKVNWDSLSLRLMSLLQFKDWSWFSHAKQAKTGYPPVWDKDKHMGVRTCKK